MKSKKLIAFLSAVTMLGSVFCTLPAMAEAGDDLIMNGTMEGAGGDNIPYYTHTDTAKKEGTEEIDPENSSWIERSGAQVHSGNYSVKIHHRTGTGKDKGFLGNYFTAPTVGKTYTVTAYIYATEDDTFVIAPLNGYWDTSNGTVTGECKAGEWTELTGEITISEWTGGEIKIWSEKNMSDFYVDDWSMIEQPDKEYAEGEICDQYSLGLALSGSGDYKVTESFTASSGVTLSSTEEYTVGKIDGQNNTITYTNTNNAMLDIEGQAPETMPPMPYDWSFSDMTVSGGGRMLIMNNTAAKATLTNVTFDQSAVNCSLINRNGTLTLDNVVFPDRTEGYDVLCEWGSGVNVFKGATKARVNRSASYYNIDVTGLTKGADLFIQFNKEHENAQTDYDNVKGQTISEDLQMVCDDANYTIHITTKADEPVVEPEFAGSVTKVVAANGTGDKADTSATAFETVISNKGGEGTVTSITWDITANGTTKSATANPTEMTLDNGASVNLVLIVNGLYTTENNTVVTVE